MTSKNIFLNIHTLVRENGEYRPQRDEQFLKLLEILKEVREVSDNPAFVITGTKRLLVNCQWNTNRRVVMISLSKRWNKLLPRKY